MKIKWHLTVVGIGTGVWLAVSWYLGSRLPPQLSWYEYPLALPVYAALHFGKGGEDMNICAGNAVWIMESAFFGLMIDGIAVAVVRRRKK